MSRPNGPIKATYVGIYQDLLGSGILPLLVYWLLFRNKLSIEGRVLYRCRHVPFCITIDTRKSKQTKMLSRLFTNNTTNYIPTMATSETTSSISKVKALAGLVNATLESRAYIDTKLLFPSINWTYLVTDQIEDNPNIANMQPTDMICKNDENILHVIHELILSIDKSRNRQKNLNDTLTAKNRQIDELNQRLEALEKKLANKEHKSRDSQITILH